LTDTHKVLKQHILTTGILETQDNGTKSKLLDLFHILNRFRKQNTWRGINWHVVMWNSDAHIDIAYWYE
jgi:hypothetical protein